MSAIIDQNNTKFLDEFEKYDPLGRTMRLNSNGCGCEKCNPKAAWMTTCDTCGNKRCPHATDHDLGCTNSNNPGQKGSSWENYETEENNKKDALWHLQNADKPIFSEGHTLPPLTRWGWSMTYNVRVELANNWGYGLEFIGPLTQNPASEDSQVLALAMVNSKYKLSTLVPRPLGETAFLAANASQVYVPGTTVFSPLADDSALEAAATETVNALSAVQEKVPISMMLDGGENGLGIVGSDESSWSKDPKVVADKGSLSWYEYSSQRKAHQQGIITDAIRKAFPNRKLYAYYHPMFIPGGPKDYTWDYKYVRTLSDLPGQTIYYASYDKFTGNNDLLSQFIDSVKGATVFGDSLSYNWVCGGWADGPFADQEVYIGFLKCLYMAGQIGAVAGYFSLPQGGFDNPDLGDDAPQWLTQIIGLGRVHALFSHIENFIRNGDLLPELNTLDQNTRALARKLRGADEWVVVAWTANGGTKKVSVKIPDLCLIEVEAIPQGSCYRVVKQDNGYGIEYLDNNKSSAYIPSGIVSRNEAKGVSLLGKIIYGIKKLIYILLPFLKR